MSHEVADFNQEVIEASREQPVLVDFWAPWCGPCRMLSPTLEKLAAEAEGRWSLVKVNTDENRELSISYRIRGIPAVKLFADGEVVAEFTGAMPEHAVRQWLDQQIPSEADKSLASARSLIEAGRMDEAVEILEELQSAPEAKLLLSSSIVFAEPDRALDLVSSLTPENAASEAVMQAVETVGGALVGNESAAVPEGPGSDDYRSAIESLKQGQIRTAVLALMQVLLKDRYYGDDAARKLGVSIFRLLGDSHPVTRELRRTFDMYLY